MTATCSPGPATVTPERKRKGRVAPARQPGSPSGVPAGHSAGASPKVRGEDGIWRPGAPRRRGSSAGDKAAPGPAVALSHPWPAPLTVQPGSSKLLEVTLRPAGSPFLVTWPRLVLLSVSLALGGGLSLPVAMRLPPSCLWAQSPAWHGPTGALGTADLNPQALLCGGALRAGRGGSDSSSDSGEGTFPPSSLPPSLCLRAVSLSSRSILFSHQLDFLVPHNLPPNWEARPHTCWRSLEPGSMVAQRYWGPTPMSDPQRLPASGLCLDGFYEMQEVSGEPSQWLPRWALGREAPWSREALLEGSWGGPLSRGTPAGGAGLLWSLSSQV